MWLVRSWDRRERLKECLKSLGRVWNWPVVSQVSARPRPSSGFSDFFLSIGKACRERSRRSLVRLWSSDYEVCSRNSIKIISFDGSMMARHWWVTRQNKVWSWTGGSTWARSISGVGVQSNEWLFLSLNCISLIRLINSVKRVLFTTISWEVN